MEVWFSLFGNSWVIPYTMKDLSPCWRAGFKGQPIADIWKAIPLSYVVYLEGM